MPNILSRIESPGSSSKTKESKTNGSHPPQLSRPPLLARGCIIRNGR